MMPVLKIYENKIIKRYTDLDIATTEFIVTLGKYRSHSDREYNSRTIFWFRDINHDLYHVLGSKTHVYIENHCYILFLKRRSIPILGMYYEIEASYNIDTGKWLCYMNNKFHRNYREYITHD